MSNLEPRFWEIAGRAHVLLVHLPIGMILAAGIVELLGRGRTRPGARGAARWCLGLGALAAVLAAGSGWIHAGFVPIARAEGGTLLLHRCTGIATALAALLTWAVSRPAGKSEGESNAYRIGLVASCVLVAATGHFGGTLVHGPGFLLAPLREEGRAPAVDAVGADVPVVVADEPVADGSVAGGDAARRAAPPVAESVPGAASAADTERPPAASAAQVAFARDVEPLLAARCYECHGPTRQKGRLRLDRLDELFARAGQTVVVPRDPDASELIARVELPADDPDVMPGKGERLTPEEIARLRAWIAAGAPLAPSAAEPASAAGESAAEGNGS